MPRLKFQPQLALRSGEKAVCKRLSSFLKQALLIYGMRYDMASGKGKEFLNEAQNEDDVIFRRVVSLHLPDPIPQPLLQDLARFSSLVISRFIQFHVADAEHKLPSVKPLTAFDLENKQDPLVTGEGWRTLQDIGIKEEIEVAMRKPAMGTYRITECTRA
ncbi:hypothetical protein PRK78_004452 [Emydomyces testavorans]|uniref:Uncharacterized protein n=1 Tax=Emydomyces testavorans TaxID=2070801 RepID=A0AAF0DIQ4_9EURO|nr:hypothetical protein PRK78_004452 [Emydomyces testavorans]